MKLRSLMFCLSVAGIGGAMHLAFDVIALPAPAFMLLFGVLLAGGAVTQRGKSG